jgi:DNA polymerase-3 subunit alpha
LKTVFCDGNLCGIFQFTNPGIRKLSINIQPDCFADVAAIGALYRPGPLGSGMDKLYAGNKLLAQSGELKYDHPILEGILKETYGCFVYQEHILELGRKLGKLSWKDTNALRKLFLKRTKDAAGKRDEVADDLKAKLTQGFVENGLTVEYAEKTWKELEAWASYGFNAAHAKAYGMISMQTAHLRTYHPLEFFAAVLKCGQTLELQGYVDDIRKQGVSILPVDANTSKLDHVIEGDAIRLSFSSVKGVGDKAAQKIMMGQPYASFEDFVGRSLANKTALEGLARCGALSCFGMSPAKAIAAVELFVSDPKNRTKKGQAAFAEALVAMVEPPELDPVDLISNEREALGCNVRWSPFHLNGRDKKVAELVESGAVATFASFIEGDEPTAVVPAMLKEFKERPQRNKKMFAFLKLVDPTGHEVEVPCFANVWQHVSTRLKRGQVYLVTVTRKDDDPSSFVVGDGKFVSSASSSMEYFWRLDDVT